MEILTAVNEMLEAIGEPPVSALDTGGTSDAGEAEAILDRVNERIQTEGWAANTLPESELEPNGSGLIAMTGVLKMEPIRSSAGRNLTMRAGYLYDLDEDTNTFDGNVWLKLVTLVDFEDLPPMLAAYIARAACLRFQRYKKRGPMDDAVNSQELAKARLEAMREDQAMRQTNVLDTDEAWRARGQRHRLAGSW